MEQTDAVALANRQKSAQTVVYIVLGYGFSLLVTVWAFYRISDGLFNLFVSVLLFFFSLLWCFAMLEGEGGREGKGGGVSKVLERDTGWQPQVTLGTCLAG